MNIFDKYVFTSDGTWFVKGSRVFMDCFHAGFVCPYGIRLCEEDEPGGYKKGEYRFDEEMCVIDEFYVNGISCSDMDLEELEKIGEEYNSEIKKYTKEELNEISQTMLKNDVRRMLLEKTKDVRLLNVLLYGKDV